MQPDLSSHLIYAKILTGRNKINKTIVQGRNNTAKNYLEFGFIL